MTHTSKDGVCVAPFHADSDNGVRGIDPVSVYE